MKKIILLISLAMCIVLVASSLTGCGKKDEDDDKIIVNISHIASESDPIHEGWVYLKNELEKRSDGRFEVTIYGNKCISNSDTENAEKVQQGIVELTSCPTSSLAAIGNVAEYNVFDYPYLFETYEDLYDVLDSDMAKGWSDKLEKAAGIKAFGGYSLGWCSVGSTKDISTFEDYSGQKIRTLSAKLQMETVNSFGASATIVNYGETFTALQQGTVDGMMTSTGLFVSDKFTEAIDYLGVTKPTALLHVPLVNAQWYNGLPDDMRQIFDECMADYLEAVRGYEEAYDQEALQAIADSGTKVIEYDDAELQKFKDASQKVYDKYGDVAGEGTVDEVKAFLKNRK